MSDSYKDQPGVYIYDTFVYPENESMFMTVVFAEIDPLQYWRDRPLLINKPLPMTAEAVNLTPEGLAEMTGNKTVIDVYDETQDIEPTLETQEKASEEIIEEMESFSFPTNDPGGSGSGSGSSSSSGSGSGPGLPRVSSSGVIVVDFFTENEIPLEGSTHINIIPEDEIIEKLGATTTLTPEWEASLAEWNLLVDDLLDTFDPVTEEIADVGEAYESQYLPENQGNRVEIAEESWKPLGEPADQWYGIPLINLGPLDIQTKDSFVVHVSSKNDYNVSLSNAVTTGLGIDTLIIDKQIPPGKKFMVGFYMIQSKFGLILRIEGEPKIYQKEIVIESDLVPKVLSYGVDNQFIKSLSGYIWDVIFWKRTSNFNHNVPTPEPTYPQDGYVYDFRKSGVNYADVGGTIDGNTLRSIYDYGPSTIAGSGPNTSDGKFIDLEPQPKNIVTGFPGIHPWSFIYETYLYKFFCRAFLADQSFTILWHQWLFQYPTGIRNWISDPVFSNYLSYDYKHFQVVFEFNGEYYRETIALPEELWTEVSLRYDR